MVLTIPQLTLHAQVILGCVKVMVKTNQCTQSCPKGLLVLWVCKSQDGADFVSLLEGPGFSNSF